MRPVSSSSPHLCSGLTHQPSSPPAHTCWDCGAQAHVQGTDPHWLKETQEQKEEEAPMLAPARPAPWGPSSLPTALATIRKVSAHWL